MKCPQCKKKVPEGLQYCTNCGFEVNTYFENPTSEIRTPQKKSPFIVALIVLAFLMILVTVLLIIADKNGVDVKQLFQSNNTEKVEVLESSVDSVQNPEGQEAQNPTQKTVSTPTPTEEQMDLMNCIRSVYASSSLEESQDSSYAPEMATDNQIGTAWVEGKEGEGIGESITVELDNSYEVHGFVINAGYQKNQEIYEKNARPERILVKLSDGTELSYKLSDENRDQRIVFDQSYITDSLTIVIKSVYSGSRYEDVCISEISLF